MKIAIIGSTQYEEKIKDHWACLIKEGHDARIPALDHHEALNELELCEYNRANIEWADEVHVIWDQRSTGTIFDFGMLFMARKPLRIIYLEPKTFAGVMRKYEEAMK